MKKVKIGEYSRFYAYSTYENKQFTIPTELQGTISKDKVVVILNYTDCQGGFLYASVAVTTVSDTTVTIRAGNAHNTGGGGVISYSVWLYY